MVLIEKLLEIIDDEVSYYENKYNPPGKKHELFNVTEEVSDRIEIEATKIIKDKKYEALGIEINGDGNIQITEPDKLGHRSGLMQNDKITKIDGTEIKADGAPSNMINTKTRKNKRSNKQKWYDYDYRS